MGGALKAIGNVGKAIIGNPITGGLAGGALLGPIGMVGGALIGGSNAKKAEQDAYQQQVAAAGDGGDASVGIMNPDSANYLSANRSPYGEALLSRANADEARAADLATRTSAAQGASSRSTIARQGGLSQGARERISKGSAYDAVMARQEAARSGEGNRLSAIASDQTMQGDEAKRRLAIMMGNQDFLKSKYASDRLANTAAAANAPHGTPFLRDIPILGNFFD